MMERHRLGMLLFISSEAIFFGCLLFVYLANRLGTGREAAELLDVPRTALFSVALFASSGTIAVAHRRVNRGDPGGARLWLLATVALGVVFLGGQVWEYLELLREDVTPGLGVWASIFFTLTSLHGLHVFAGLVALATVWSVANSPAFLRRAEVVFEPVSLYWHFVDVVWVVIFGLVYLWSLFA